MLNEAMLMISSSVIEELIVVNLPLNHNCYYKLRRVWGPAHLPAEYSPRVRRILCKQNQTQLMVDVCLLGPAPFGIKSFGIRSFGIRSFGITTRRVLFETVIWHNYHVDEI